MMMGIIIKDLSNKLGKYIDENNGEVFVNENWTNEWLEKNSAPFVVNIVDQDGKEVKDFKLSIKRKP
jgi:hypothetical protein